MTNGIKTIDSAIEIINNRIANIPEFEIYQSTLKQLTYLSSILNGTEEDMSNLDKIIVGHYAVREFEESDPELASALKKCQSIAFKLDAGLEI
jgi:hypothetical protein